MIDRCKNNPENLSTTKVSEHIPSGFSISSISLFRSTENKHHVYRGKDSKKMFCQSLREHAIKVINFEKKQMKLLTKEQQKSCEDVNICYISKDKFENKYLEDKKYCKVRGHCHYTGKYRSDAHIICKLKYSVPNKCPIVFHNVSAYDLTFYERRVSRRI